jgi:hypothetical protein
LLDIVNTRSIIDTDIPILERITFKECYLSHLRDTKKKSRRRYRKMIIIRDPMNYLEDVALVCLFIE